MYDFNNLLKGFYMKKILAVLTIAVAAMAFASSSHAQIKVGAGYGLATHTEKYVTGNDSETEDPSNMSGFYVEAAYEWKFMSKNWGDLSLQPGITYSFYGETDDESDSIEGIVVSGKSSVREHYLNIPVLVNYSYDLVPGKVALSAYAGPVFSLGLASNAIIRVDAGDESLVTRTNLYNGNTSVKGTMNGEKINETTKGEGTDYGMFDLKLGVGVGATFLDKYEVRIAYNIGLLDRITDSGSEINSISRTNVLQIGVAYKF